MTALSIRLSNAVQAHLKAEAQLAGKTQSEIARLAIVEYLARREKERFLQELAAAGRAMKNDPEATAESLEIANDLVDEGLDDIIADERGPAVKWWK